MKPGMIVTSRRDLIADLLGAALVAAIAGLVGYGVLGLLVAW